MRWTCCGHAMWMVEASGLRIVMDPLLGETYHDGTFAVVPRREIDCAALQPDVLIVTHRHPDHFDLESLHTLARHYPDVVVLTADALVGQAAQKLGFASVSLLPDWQHLPLPGLDLLTTPSFCPVEEWGVMLATADGVVWNQVDTELGERIPAMLARAAEILQRPTLTQRLDLGIVRWQPLLQVNAMLGERTRFPTRPYAGELDRIAACQAGALIPGAAGSQLTTEGWLNAHAYPVSTARIQRDLAARCPQATIFEPRPGAQWRLEKGAVTPLPDADWLTVLPTADARRFHPFERPPVVDPDPEARGTAALQSIIEPWLIEALAPAVGATLLPHGPRQLSLEVIYPDGPAHYCLQIRASDVLISSKRAEDPDQCNVIAASDLALVIEGRAHWGRPLLAGRLRSSGGLYTVNADGLQAVKTPPFFLYLALPYERATERWVDSELARLTASR